MATGQWASRVAQPFDRVAQFPLRHRAARRSANVSLDIFERTLEHVQVVKQRVQLRLVNDDLVSTKREICRTLTRHPIPLPATLTTEQLGSPAASSTQEHASTPSAPHFNATITSIAFLAIHAVFCHDNIVVDDHTLTTELPQRFSECASIPL